MILRFGLVDGSGHWRDIDAKRASWSWGGLLERGPASRSGLSVAMASPFDLATGLLSLLLGLVVPIVSGLILIQRLIVSRYPLVPLFCFPFGFVQGEPVASIQLFSLPT